MCAPSLPWKPSPAVVVLLLLLLALLLLLLLVVVVVASASTTIAPQKARFLPVWCEMDRWWEVQRVKVRGRGGLRYRARGGRRGGGVQLRANARTRARGLG